MRMIAAILDCPFHLSIMSEAPVQPRSTAALEKAAIARTDAVEKKQAEEIQTEKMRTEEPLRESTEAPESGDRVRRQIRLQRIRRKQMLQRRYQKRMCQKSLHSERVHPEKISLRMSVT